MDNELQKQMMARYASAKLQDLVAYLEANNKEWNRGLTRRQIIEILLTEVRELDIEEKESD